MIPQLKSLELQGYKTFASKTLFEFPVRITAIVGPNGAGKSNIADSLRWVLGEQTYSLLRGKKTIDMIFAGSEQKSRSSMAACKVTFDNSSGWLPIDYGEVAITRRAYRDGQNEYLLNGQRVRLKEITELLANAGLAERTYTIIGQGLVDSALSLRPEERRKFFEEASGIGLYHNRREESITRLEKTRRNLERVHDILGELEPRLKSLEKQAQKAREYERIQADLKILLREWYGYHWHKSQNDLALSYTALKDQEEELETARLDLSKINSRRDSVQSMVLERRNTLNQMRNQLTEFYQNKEKINRSLAVFEERNRSLNEQLLRMENDLVRNQEEYKTTSDRITSLSEDLNRFAAEKKEAEAKFLEATKLFSERHVARQDLENQLNYKKKEVIQAETDKIQTALRLQELENQIARNTRSIETINEKVINEKSLSEKCQVELDDLASIIAQLDASIQFNRDEIHRQEDTLIDRQKNLSSLHDKLTSLERGRTKLKAQIDVIEQAEKKFTGFNKGTRTIMTLKREGKLKGEFAVLGDLIEVDSNYEKAISALLGDYFDAVFLKGHTDTDQVLMILEAEDGSQTYLIPTVNDFTESKQPEIEYPNTLGRASDFIKIDPEFDNVINSLVGQAFIVRDRQSARKAAGLLHENARFVTLTGEVFFSNGIILSAHTGRETLIARPREKRELIEKMSSLETEIKGINVQVADIQNQIELKRSQKVLTEKENRKSQIDLDQLRKKHQDILLNTEMLSKSCDFYTQQLLDRELSLKTSGVTKDELLDKQLVIEKQIESAGKDLAVLERELSRLPLEDLQIEKMHWETNIAVLNRALMDIDTRKAELIKDDNLNRTQKQHLEILLQETQNSIGLLWEEKQSYENDLIENSNAIENLHKKIEPEEMEHENYQKEVQELQNQYNNTMQSSSLAERHVIQAQMDMSRKKDKLEALRKKIEEDFGLVEFEYASTIDGPKPLPFKDLVSQLPLVPEIKEGIEDSINIQRVQLRRLGSINPEAQKEFDEVNERFNFLNSQVNDLREADTNLQTVISELDELMRNKFQQTFASVAEEFKEMFARLFGGGSASLVLVDEENLSETGIEIIARLPGRREQGLSLLSGGERSLTAVALIFALLRVSPTPFCVLDEVDAMLDEANVGRFCELLVELSQKTQFVVITHNRNTVQNADIIYGVTMGRDSASQVISLKLEDVDAVIEK